MRWCGRSFGASLARPGCVRARRRGGGLGWHGSSPKPERHDQCCGLGLYRFYLAPPDVIGLADLPPGWGLLHAQGTRVIEVLRPLGNMWPGAGSELQGWREFQHPVNEAAERAVLFSIARRLTEAQPRRPGGPPLTPPPLP